jgi:hypothetical protein
VKDAHDWLVVTGAGDASVPEDDDPLESEPDDVPPPPVSAVEEVSEDPESVAEDVLADEESVAEGVPADDDAVAGAAVVDVPDEDAWPAGDRAAGRLAGLVADPPAGVCAALALADALRAGSCPLASRSKIKPHATTKTTRVTAMTRRRIVRTRCRRARSRWRPSVRARVLSSEAGGGTDAGIAAAGAGEAGWPGTGHHLSSWTG